MADLNSLFATVKSVTSYNFDQVAIEVFNYQAKHNPVFREYLSHIGHSGAVDRLEDIAFLPIEFFKGHQIKTGAWEAETVFESSGTTGSQTSRHFVPSLSQYQIETQRHFEAAYGILSDFNILALLPSYLERNNSGLIAMVDHFLSCTMSQDSGYYLNVHDRLFHKLKELKGAEKKTILWGVTFALLDFAENYTIDFPDLIVMETGGMKGRREEMVREEVHAVLKNAFHVGQIHSEYGMTELNSQAYAKKDGSFVPAPSMKIVVRDINDPFSTVERRKTGALNIIDLQNLYTCSFIETKDLGRIDDQGGFEVLGRMDNADIRGCNLMLM